MPATPFPHPSVHTTTTIPSLACSNIRPRSLMYSVAGSAQSLAVIQSRHIKMQAEDHFWSSIYAEATESFSKMHPKVNTSESVGIKLPCRWEKWWFMTAVWWIYENLDLLVHKNIFRSENLLAGAAPSGLHGAKMGISNFIMYCKHAHCSKREAVLSDLICFVLSCCTHKKGFTPLLVKGVILDRSPAGCWVVVNPSHGSPGAACL